MIFLNTADVEQNQIYSYDALAIDKPVCSSIVSNYNYLYMNPLKIEIGRSNTNLSNELSKELMYLFFENTPIGM